MVRTVLVLLYTSTSVKTRRSLQLFTNLLNHDAILTCIALTYCIHSATLFLIIDSNQFGIIGHDSRGRRRQSTTSCFFVQQQQSKSKSAEATVGRFRSVTVLKHDTNIVEYKRWRRSMQHRELNECEYW
jgi:hypothetical protein